MMGHNGGTGVDDSYQLPFKFTGSIDKLTFKLGPEQVTAEERNFAEHVLATAHD
jgi:hypothetical protein